MTLYSIFVSNEPMEVLDKRGISETVVDEMGEQQIVAEDAPFQFMYSLEGKNILVSAPSEKSLYQLHIFHWDDPPYDMKFFNKKPYVYGAEGNWNEQYMEDLYHYIKQHVNPNHKVELLRFWADGVKKPLKKVRLTVATLELKDIIALENRHDIRVIFE